MANAMIKMSKNTFLGIVDAVKQKRGIDKVAVSDLRDEILAISGDTFKFLVTAEYPKASLENIEHGEHVLSPNSLRITPHNLMGSEVTE
ncbi:MAG: hypothetical protein MJ236_03710 [Clostridia bacterium]|nr:hypothetical protein [Clostridia bacterium]